MKVNEQLNTDDINIYLHLPDVYTVYLIFSRDCSDQSLHGGWDDMKGCEDLLVLLFRV